MHWECQQESGLCEAAPDASPAMISLCPQTCPLPPLPRLGFLSCEEQVVLLCEVVSRVKRTKVCVESIVCYKKGSFDGDPLPSSLQFRNGLSKLCSVFKTQVRHQCGGGLLRAALAFCMLTLLHAGCGLSLTGSSWGTGAEGHPTPSIPLPRCALHCGQHFPASVAAGFGPVSTSGSMDGGWKVERKEEPGCFSVSSSPFHFGGVLGLHLL